MAYHRKHTASIAHGKSSGERTIMWAPQSTPPLSPPSDDARDADMMPVAAMRAIAVEAIRDATGCPDLKGRDGEYLVDKLERLAALAAAAMKENGKCANGLSGAAANLQCPSA